VLYSGDVRDFGWEIAHAAVSSSTMVARPEGYTYAALMESVSSIQGPFPVGPDSQLWHRCTPSLYKSLYTMPVANVV
jgi:hypothetical protein